LIDPNIEITGGGITERQYFERGASGVRYLNLSKFSGIEWGNGETIFLKGHHVVWKDQEVDLYLFRNDPIGKETVLIVEPHPDDAEIAAFGLYSINNTYIVTVTAGDAGYIPKSRDKIRESMLKGKLRVWDSITAPFLGGVSPYHVVNLGYFDGMLEEMYRRKPEDIYHKWLNTADVRVFRQYNLSDLVRNKSQMANWKNLVDDLEYILDRIKPGIIITPHIYLDRHKDHKISTIALFEAIRKSNLKKAKIYLYTNHHIYSEYYPFGPAHSAVSLPPWFEHSFQFRSIFSPGLSTDKQHEKMIALEAQHDLREEVAIYDYSLLWMIRNIKNSFLKYYNFNIIHGDSTYYRRAVRSNELFYVIDIADMHSFEREYLQDIQGQK